MSDAEKNILFMYNKLPHALQMWLLSTLTGLAKMPQGGTGEVIDGAASNNQLLH